MTMRTMRPLTLPGIQTDLTNWSKSAQSLCYVFKARNREDIIQALEAARAHGRSVIPHGAGHSYTDAALNTGGVVLDLTPMRRILSWDAEQGIMQVEPGVTLRDMIRVAWQDGWWPVVSPSTPDVTIGGCTAMNVTGKNAWKEGSFGEHLSAIEVLLATGEARTLLPERDMLLFHAFVGSVGLLGVITSVTVQLQRLSSSRVTIRRRSAASFAEIFTIFAEEQQSSDFLEAWVDGCAEGKQLGRGQVACETLHATADEAFFRFPAPGISDRLAVPLARLAGRIGRPVLTKSVGLANRANYWWGRQGSKQQRGLLSATYWPPAALAGYHALLPQGVETFQAFVPGCRAQDVFAEILRFSHAQGCLPIWCVIKQHRRDPFRLSYQVDGFSLELNYQRTHQHGPRLERVLREMIAIVIDAGGRFYLAKDHFLTHAQYRHSVGDEAVDTFLQLKQRYDPERLLQSDLYHRVFQPALQCSRE